MVRSTAGVRNFADGRDAAEGGRAAALDMAFGHRRPGAEVPQVEERSAGGHSRLLARRAIDILPDVPERLPTDEHRRIHAWLSGSGRWLTVTGLPGVGKRETVAEVLAVCPAADGVQIIDRASPRDTPLADGERVIAISAGRGLYEAEQVIEIEARPDERAAARFVEVARRVEPQHRLEVDHPVVRALVERVGGHRLALELLASYLLVLEPEQLLERLDRPPNGGADPLMHAIGSGARLRERLDGSWLSVAPPHRDLLARCQVFAGPFSVADVDAVLGIDDAAALQGLQALRARNLLQRLGGRLAVWPIVRRYLAACRPVSDPWHVARHRRHFADRARAALESIPTEGSSALDELASIEGELVDIVHAGPMGGHGEAVGNAALALATLAQRRGDLIRKRALLDHAARIAETAEPEVRARIFLAAAADAANGGRAIIAREWLDRVGDIPVSDRLQAERRRVSVMERVAAGDFEQARLHAIAFVEASRRSDDPRDEAKALQLWGTTLNQLSRPAEAEGPLKAALAAYRSWGSAREVLVTQLNLMVSCRHMGELERACALAEDCLRMSLDGGFGRLIALGWSRLGHLQMHRGRRVEADHNLRRGWALCRSGGIGTGAFSAGLDLALLAIEAGQLDEAQAWLDRVEFEVCGAYRETGADAGKQMTLPEFAMELRTARAMLAFAAGRLDEATTAAQHALADLDRGTMRPTDMVNTLATHAGIAHACGDRAAAMRSLERAGDILKGVDLPVSRCQVDIGALRVGEIPPADLVARVVDGLGRIGQSWWLRRSMRLLWPTLSRDVRREARALSAIEGPTLVLEPESRSVRLPDGTWVDFGRRQLLWALLTCVVEHEGPSPPETIVAAVWPGEAIHPEAAMNRLHNALSLIRASGLRGIVVRSGDAYMIDGALRTHILDPLSITAFDTESLSAND